MVTRPVINVQAFRTTKDVILKRDYNRTETEPLSTAIGQYFETSKNNTTHTYLSQHLYIELSLAIVFLSCGARKQEQT